MHRQSALLIGANLLVQRLLDIAYSNLAACFLAEHVLVGVIIIRTLLRD
jgi:hypothetical protein